MVEHQLLPAVAGRCASRRGVAAAVLGLVALSAVPARAGSAATDAPPVTAGGRLTVLEVAARVLDTHPAVQAARARRDAARSAAGEEAAARRPTLSAQGSVVRFEEPMVVTPIHTFAPGFAPDFDDTLVQGGVVLSYTLFDGGARGARIRRSDAEAAATAAEEEGTEQALLARAVGAYLRVLGLGETLAAHRRRLEALAAERGRVEQLFAVGRAAEVDRRRIAASVAAAEADRVRLAANLDAAERSLARLVGLEVERTRYPELTPVAAIGEPLRRDVLVARARAASPAVAEARERLRAAEAASEVVASVRWPTVQLAGGYTDFGSSQGDFTAEWNAGVRFTLPLYAGGAFRQRTARVEALAVAAGESLRLAERDVADSLDAALAAVAAAEARVGSLETAVAELAEVARVEQLRLATGVGTEADYLASEAELLASRAALAAARHDAVAARLEVARASGDLDLAWLGAHLEEVDR